MKATLLALLAAAALLAGCKYTQTAKATPTAPPIDLSAGYPMLDSADIYDMGSIEAWRPTGDAIVYARKVYLNAVDRYANQKDTRSSLPLFLRALRIAPEPVMYLRYGEALLQDTQYELAFSTAMMAQRDSTLAPDADMLAARSAAHLDAQEYAMFLAMALQSGKFDIREVAAYSDFDSLRDQDDFKVMLARYDYSNEQRRQALMTLFGRSFPRQGLPFAIEADSLRTESYRYIDYMFDDIIPELGGMDSKFSRGTEQSFQYVAELPGGAGFSTFVYRSVNYVLTSEEDREPYHYFLMTVDTTGQRIDQIELACACSNLRIATATIDTTGLIAVRSIRQTYRYNPVDSGYEHNEVVKQEPTGITYYRITAGGKIEQQDKPATAVNEPPRAPEVIQWPEKEYTGSPN